MPSFSSSSNSHQQPMDPLPLPSPPSPQPDNPPPPPSHCHPHSRQSSSSSSSSSSSNHRPSSTPLISLRQCRICLLSSESRRKPLISPCRCSGTVQHVHVHCLAHWIEVSSRKYTPPPQCELCGFRYRRRPFVNVTRLHLPFMDLRDRILNFLCLFLLLIMGLCAWVALQQLKNAEKRQPAETAPTISNLGGAGTRRISRFEFSQPDLIILVAVLLLFAAFFLALFTQYRANVTIFRALSRLWVTNRNWQIRNYSTEADTMANRGSGGSGKKGKMGRGQIGTTIGMSGGGIMGVGGTTRGEGRQTEQPGTGNGAAGGGGGGAEGVGKS